MTFPKLTEIQVSSVPENLGICCADCRFRNSSFAQIRQHLARPSMPGLRSRRLSDRTGSPQRRSDGAASMPSAFMLLSPTDEGTRTAENHSTSVGGANAGSVGGGAARPANPVQVLTTACTAPVDGIGSTYGSQNQGGLDAVPEDFRMDDNVPASPDKPEDEGPISEEWASKIVKLCDAIVRDRKANEFTKQQALLLRCEVLDSP
jgi:hypothetical protein